MNKLLKSKPQEYLILSVLLLSLSILGFLVFRHVSLSQLPPLHDAMDYLVKAKNFWYSVGQNKWFNPLNIEPTFRPPGTVLMSYPFGFSENTHNFYFRAIFLPITLFVAALWIITKPHCSRLKEQWLLVLFCLAFTTLPLFYHFEPNRLLNSPTYWGLVDNFFAAMAALGTALVIRGVYSLSISLTVSGIITSAFCLFIKPAGTIIMVAIFLVWAAYVLTVRTSVPAVRQRNRQFQKYLIFSIASYVCIYGLAVLLSSTSQYLSLENVNYGNKAMELLKLQEKEWFYQEFWPLLRIQIHTAFGWHWLAFIVLTCAFSFSRTRRKLPIDLLCALGVISLGLWFWFIATGPSQTRFFLPFALMSLTLCFPRINSFYATISDRHFRIVTVSLLCPFILLLLLLLPSSSPIFLQRIFGVNLTSGSLVSEVQQAKSIVEQASKAGRDLNLYSFTIDNVDAPFYYVGIHEKNLHQNLSSFHTKVPHSWISNSTFRLSEMAASDYLVFKPILDSAQAAEVLKKVEVADFIAESQLFHAWASTANEDSGLKIESETSLRLLKIIDRSKFANALEQLRSKYKWRKVFLEANLVNWKEAIDANPSKWLDRAAASKLIAKSDKAFRGIHFGNKFSLLGVLSKRTNDGLRIELIWESLKDQPLLYTNYVHLVDAEGNILTQADYPQEADKQFVNKGRLWHDVAKFPTEKLTGVKAIGLGIYILPSVKMLTVEHSSTDLDGQRLLVGLN